MHDDLRELVDIENGFIRGEIFHSAEIYDRELEQVFARSWLFLAHDAMIPKKGDFVQTYMGEDPVIVVRQADGSVRAFMNQCRHRGMRICRADLGNARAFMCSFHGWTYDISGNLVGVPFEAEAFGPDFDKSQWGPRQVPQLTNYKGFIFGNWDPTAPSFEDYLGDMAWYMDAYIDRYEGGIEPIATHKWVVPCNWKFNAEQPSSDGYHGSTTHASATQVLLGQNADPRSAEGWQFTSPFGHGTGFGNKRLRSGSGQSGLKTMQWYDSVYDQVVARLGQARADYVRGHANLFPNFSFLSNGTMRVTHPRGPHEMEIWAWTFAPVDAPPEIREDIRLNVLRTFSAAGLFEQDDSENWIEEQRILRGYMARKDPLLYRMQLGNTRDNADGLPGRTVASKYADEGARGLYQHWLDMMVGESWEDVLAMKAARKSPATKLSLATG